jgi:hypothetical protein
MRMRPWALLLISGAIYAYVGQHEWVNGRGEVARFLACFAALFAATALAQRWRLGFPWVVAGGLLFRVLLWPAGWADGEFGRFQLYDSDAWRFLWDGHVWGAGVNPYAHAPNAPELDGLAGGAWQQIREWVSYGDVRTIYPPAAQWLFRGVQGVQPGSVAAVKVVATLLDLACWALLVRTLRRAGRPATESLWWGWNPLVVKVFAGSGHVVDALLCCALAGLLDALHAQRRAAAGAWWAVAVLTKGSPLLLLPLLWRRLGWRGGLAFAAATFLITAPVAHPRMFDGVREFAAFWEFNGGWYVLLRQALTAPAARVVSLAVLAGVVYAALQKVRRHRAFFWPAVTLLIGAPVLLSPALMPWYLTWTLPAAVLSRSRAWIAGSGIVFAAFWTMAEAREVAWVVVAEWLTMAAWLVFEYRRPQEETA